MTTGTKFKDIYDGALHDPQALEHFWEDDPYEDLTWEVGNNLVRKYLPDGGIVLDLGCGIYPHSEVAFDVTLVGADISAGSLKSANANYRHLPISYICADAVHLPFRDGQIDLVIAVGELWNHVNSGHLLKELRRILSVGGIIIIDAAMKLCLYNLYMFLGSVLKMHFAKDIDRGEAIRALKHPLRPCEITWQITPQDRATVSLPTAGSALETIRASGLALREVFGTVVASDIVPRPIQNLEESSGVVRRLLRILRQLDSKLGGLGPFWRLGGNCFFVLQNGHGTERV